VRHPPCTPGTKLGRLAAFNGGSCVELLRVGADTCRSIFLTEASTPRPGRRVLSVALGPHHKPFESARTARGLRARNLVGALHALWRAERRGAREKGGDQHRRTIRVWHHRRFQSRQGGLEWIQRFLKGGCVAWDGTCPAARDRILPKEIRWRPPKCRNRLPRWLVQI